MTEMKLIPRNEVEEKYTWDMTLLYKTDEDFKASLENIKKEILDFKATYEGKLANHATLDTAVKKYEELYEEYYKLSHYAELPMAVDRFNDNVVQNVTLFEDVSTLWAGNLSFFDTELVELDEQFIKDFVKNYRPDLEYYFEKIVQEKKHTLSKEAEQVIANYESLPGYYNLYEVTKHEDILKAIELIAKYLRKAVENDEEAKEKMALASYLAGMGFSNVGLGIVHSMAHPLGAFYGTPHGVANAIILPTVMEYNAEYTGEKFREIAKAFGIKHTKKMAPEEYRKAVEENNLSPIADIKLEKYEDNEDNNETRLYLTESELQEFALDLLNLVREVIFSLKNAIQISENEKQSTLSSEVALIPINYEEVDLEDKL